jgi:4-amino-4-deoxy-L-arabinose transferase-like glycosyltransferase
LRRYFSLRAWPWALVTGLPWFIAVTLRRPDFPYYAVVYESLERVSTATFGRTRPIWFFVPILLGGSFPWIVPAIAGFVEAVRCRTARRGVASRAPLLAISWALMPLVFFSFSQSSFAALIAAVLVAAALTWRRPAVIAIAVGAALVVAVGLATPQLRHHVFHGSGVSLNTASSGRVRSATTSHVTWRAGSMPCAVLIRPEPSGSG